MMDCHFVRRSVCILRISFCTCSQDFIRWFHRSTDGQTEVTAPLMLRVSTELNLITSIKLQSKNYIFNQNHNQWLSGCNSDENSLRVFVEIQSNGVRTSHIFYLPFKLIVSILTIFNFISQPRFRFHFPFALVSCSWHTNRHITLLKGLSSNTYLRISLTSDDRIKWRQKRKTFRLFSNSVFTHYISDLTNCATLATTLD